MRKGGGGRLTDIAKLADTRRMFGKRNNWRPEDILQSQLAMNAKTWQALQHHGVDEETEVRLDFFYEAPDLDSANELATFLTAETDYEVRADKNVVAGSTATGRCRPE